jgi:hypothetical protein
MAGGNTFPYHRKGEFLRSILQILAQSNGAWCSNILDELDRLITPTAEELRGIPSNPSYPRYHKVAAWLMNAAKNAGWIEKMEGSRGTYRITPAGIEAYNRISDPEALVLEVLRLAGWGRKSDI